MKQALGGALARLSEIFSPPGDAALRGLEHDLSRMTTFGQSWRRLCETAWTLGFLELSLEPVPEAESFLPARCSWAPEPGGGGALGRLGEWALPRRPVGESLWAFELVAEGRAVALVHGRRRLVRPDFDPERFVRVMQAMVGRFVAVPWAEATAGAPAVVALGEPRPAAAAE